MAKGLRIEEPTKRPAELVEALAEVWEASVRATHGFLAEDDIVGMRPEVRAGLAGVAALALAREGDDAGAAAGAPVGFAGVEDGKLEMLFVAPEARGRGVGSALLAHAVHELGARALDVNEQNPQAVGFYRHEGFTVTGRSATDDAGRPWPLLRMELLEARPHMESGAWFDAADAGLERARIHARHVMRRFNADPALTDEERAELVRGLFGALGEGSTVSTGAQVDYGFGIFVGRNCFFNFNCTFLDGARIEFGDDVWAGPGCTFATPLHPLLGRERAMRFDADGAPHLWERNLPITVGSDVWIGANVTVNPGVTIGEGAVVGSGSVVTKDVPPRMLAFGNPCRAVRAITEADGIEGGSVPIR